LGARCFGFFLAVILSLFEDLKNIFREAKEYERSKNWEKDAGGAASNKINKCKSAA
jgi:hypothetical protein